MSESSSGSLIGLGAAILVFGLVVGRHILPDTPRDTLAPRIADIRVAIDSNPFPLFGADNATRLDELVQPECAASWSKLYEGPLHVCKIAVATETGEERRQPEFYTLYLIRFDQNWKIVTAMPRPREPKG